MCAILFRLVELSSLLRRYPTYFLLNKAIVPLTFVIVCPDRLQNSVKVSWEMPKHRIAAHRMMRLEF
jgi:hypothetical protein